jgi:Lrp/AsnC family transcriptional regulator, leucine-responsive regulatory protein
MTRDSGLDRFDLALLDLVQRDNLTPARRLGESVGLSESAVLRRLRRLRRDKIIAADVSVVSAAAIGQPLTIIALVSLERESAAIVDAFSRRIRARVEVRHCWYVTGESDWVVVLQLDSMAGYEAFTREIFLGDPNVRSFRTLVAMREVMSEAGAKIAPRRAVRSRSDRAP